MYALGKFLRGATRSPSGANGQQWEIQMLEGVALKVIGEAHNG